MSKLSMFSYSWDLAENSVAKTVAEFKKIGINSVTLVSSYHASTFFDQRVQPIKFIFRRVAA